jgi:hypothetical protein
MEEACGFDGNNDIYGLGVRIGIYLQLTTIVFSDNMYPPAIEANRNGNISFQVAMLAGLILVTQKPEVSLNALECYITLLFCLASAWTGSVRVPSYKGRVSSSCVKHYGSNISGFSEAFFGMAVCSYGIWISFAGLDHMPRTKCAEITFLFSRVELFGWFRNLLRSVLVMGMGGSTVLAIMRIASLIRKIHQQLSRWGESELPPSDPTTTVLVVNFSTVRLLCGCIPLLIFIVAIELTLAWNEVKGIYSCNTFSQIFPLVIGMSGMCRTLYPFSRAVVLGDLRFAHI